MKLFGSKTIKSKLIQSNFCIICIVTIIASTCSYVTANKKTVQIAKDSLKYDVENIAYNYQVPYEEMLNIILNCTERKTFNLKGLDKYDTIDSRSRALSYVNLINNFCAITNYGNYISKLAVFNDKGALIQAGSSLGSNDDYERIISTDWFKSELTKTIDYYQLNIVDSPFYSDNIQMLPIVRTLSDNDGWILICLSTKLFQDVLNEKLDSQEAIVVTSTGKKIASIYELPENKSENDKIIKMLLDEEENKGILEIKVHGKDSLVAYHKDKRSGILIYETVSLDSIKSDKVLLIQTIIIMFSACLIIGLIVSIIFTNQMNKPIDKLVRHIKIISKGNFVKDESIETEDEIGSIGKIVNSMSGQIKNLMEQRMETEKEKSSLELKMLQAQINPHFLYNTLDSIKWIAIIQKNSGIVKVVTALSGLLKNMAKGFNEKVTLQKELDFLSDYVTIEKVKYVELFDIVIDVEEESLYEAKVIKLTLQPLVENAIFNGIEPSEKNGTININVFSKNNNLYITVKDNGIGIPSNKLDNLLNDTEKVESDHMSGIGLPNVDRRIKLIYGDNYGLTIESEVDKYTQITIKTPLEY